MVDYLLELGADVIYSTPQANRHTALEAATGRLYGSSFREKRV